MGSEATARSATCIVRTTFAAALSVGRVLSCTADDHRARAVASGVVEVILRAARMHSEAPQLAEAALSAIRNLACHGPDMRPKEQSRSNPDPYANFVSRLFTLRLLPPPSAFKSVRLIVTPPPTPNSPQMCSGQSDRLGYPGLRVCCHGPSPATQRRRWVLRGSTVGHSQPQHRQR